LPSCESSFQTLSSQKSKHKTPTSQDSCEYFRRKNRLSPYYDPDAVDENLEEQEVLEENEIDLENKDKSCGSEDLSLSNSTGDLTYHH